jgi:hypothetical protein
VSGRFVVVSVTGYPIPVTSNGEFVEGNNRSYRRSFAVLDTAVNHQIVKEFNAGTRVGERMNERRAEALCAALNEWDDFDGDGLWRLPDLDAL